MVVTGFYTDGQYLKNNPAWHLDDSSWKADSIQRIIERNHISPQTICDVGCGVGEILRLLQQKMEPGAVFLGYDIAPHAIEQARLRENDRLHFKLGDFFQEEDGHFDLLLMIGVLEHFENMFEVLRDIKGRSEYKIFLLPMDLSLASILRDDLVRFRRAAGHLHFFTKNVMFDLLKDLGYEVVDFFYVFQPVDTMPWKQARRSPGRFLKKLAKEILLGLPKLPGRLLYVFHKDLAVRVFPYWRLLVVAK